MTKWPRVKLEEIADIIMGQSPEGEYYNQDEKGKPLITGSGQMGEIYPCPSQFSSRGAKESRAGDIIISIRASIGDLNWSDREYFIGRGVAAVRPRKELDPHYAWWALSTYRVSLEAQATGSTFKQIKTETLASLRIPLPPIDQQRRIAAILDQAEALRTKRRQALAKLDTLTQSLFLEMFGNPVSNPFGWPGATLGDLIRSASDGPHVSPSYSDQGIPFLSTRHIQRGEILWQDLKFLSEADAAVQWRKCKPVRGDVLYTKGGTTGLAVAIDFDRPIAVWVHVALLKPNPEKVDAMWLESMLNTSYCYAQSQRYTHGIANRDLGLKRMIKIMLYLPPLKSQREFVQKRNNIKMLANKLRASLSSLDWLLESLQHRAFRGEL